jgi:hypothetical protein
MSQLETASGSFLGRFLPKLGPCRKARPFLFVRMRLSVLFVLLAVLLAPGVRAQPLAPVDGTSVEGRALIERLRAGGLVLYFRHADTLGMPCDRSFRVGDREG